eukprot:CAMPEP_0198302914 /NCGR_PEP_ID=MMETSP1449-20131203/56616_1 /TAXON_ID=420275 /ORGANISM="Attheya septentrionalis, Strain CCMP2084" /LENGTH=329 /DNA_ID=CAMNT_0044005393 /DNA_START=222 /DNA_END=1211 /DNA_ORIENTATION=+
MKWIGIVVVSVVSWVSLSLAVVEAGQPLSVLVTLRGKKYSISNVSTVEEARQKVEEQSGVSLQKQTVLFGGSKLKSTDVLDEVGVSNGAVLNLVPKKKASSSSTSTSAVSASASAVLNLVPKKKASSSSTSTSAVSASAAASAAASASAPSSGAEAMESAAEAVKGMLEQAGVDPEQLSQLMGGGADGNGKMPDMQESMEMMQNLMSSPMFQEFMNDPAKLEQSRKMILENEMMKGMMAGLPGFDEILNDPDQWRETMQAAANMYKSMGSSLMSAMMGAGGDMNTNNNNNNNWGMPPSSAFGGLGGFDMAGATATTAPTALDELSEGED